MGAQGETVPYVICVEVGADGQAAAGGAHGKGLAQRAYHPDEIRAADGRLALDVEYYLAQQARPQTVQPATLLA
jgi:DNA polymerase alpha subunit A